MKRALLPLSLPVLSLLVVAGCRPSTHAYVPTPPPKVEAISTDVSNADVIMPLAVGNQWTYSMRNEAYQDGKPLGKLDQEVAYRVVTSKPSGDAYLVLESGGQVIDAQDWRTTGKGLYQVTSGLKRTPYTTAQPLALLPLEAGHRFSWKGKGAMSDGSISNATAESETLAPQTVDTGMGPLSAVPVVTKMKFANGTSENTSWFRPGVGLVRYRQTTDIKGRRTVIVLTLTGSSIK